MSSSPPSPAESLAAAATGAHGALWSDVYESGARAGFDALLGELGLDLSVREKGLDAAQALVRRFATAVLDGPLKADFGVTSPEAIARHVAVGHARAGDKAVVAARADLARKAVALRAAERQLQELSALCGHADACARVVREHCTGGDVETKAAAAGRGRNIVKNKKATDGGGTTLSVSALARQTDDTERSMMDAIAKVNEAAEQFETRYPAAQLRLPLPSPLGSGVASMAMTSGDAMDDATNSTKRRKTNNNWSGKEGMVSSPAVRELLYHLTK